MRALGGGNRGTMGEQTARWGLGPWPSVVRTLSKTARSVFLFLFSFWFSFAFVSGSHYFGPMTRLWQRPCGSEAGAGDCETGWVCDIGVGTSS